MPISKLFFTSIISLNLLVLTACNIPEPRARVSGTDAPSTFYISTFNGRASSPTVEKNSAVPTSRTFHFSVCLKDQAHNTPLSSQTFRIEELHRELKTDANGCLNWNEEVPFSYASQSKYLEWRRQITATGLHKGTRQAPFAINPWSDIDNSEPVVNLDQYTPPNLVAEAPRAQKNKNTLWMNEMRIQSTESHFTTGGVTLDFDLMSKPQIQVTKANGEKILNNLDQGSFKAKIYLIHHLTEGAHTHRLVLAESELQNVALKGGYLFIRAPLNLSMIPTRGQLLLGIDLTAVDSQEQLGNFQGVYTIGDYDQLKTSSFLRLAADVSAKEKFLLRDFITTTLAEKVRQHSDAYMKPRIEVAPLEFKFIRVGRESTSEREIIFNVRACVKNGLEQKNTRAYTFDVRGFQRTGGESAKVTRITTDNSACINWDESLIFKYYECRKYLKGTIEIENQDLAVKQRLEIAINPWESSSSFARDLRYVDAQDSLTMDCKDSKLLPSTLSLRSFNYSTLSYAYEIDHQLNMSIKKKFRVKLDAAVSIFSDMSNGRMESAQKLRPGIYLLKVALIKNRDYYNQKSFVSSAEALVSTLDGDIKTDLEFKTADLKALGDRNTLLVELHPVREDKVTISKEGEVTAKNKISSLDDVIDHDTGLYSRVFTGVMSLNQEKDSQELTALDMKEANEYLAAAHLPALDSSQKSLVREYIKYGQNNELERLKNQSDQASAKSFARKNKLKMAVVNEPTTYGVLAQALSERPARMDATQITKELNQVATTGKLSRELARGLCFYWFRNFIGREIKDTVKPLAVINCGMSSGKPETLFSVEKRLFVKELGGYKYIKGFNSVVTVGSNISLTKSSTRADSRTKSLNLNLGLTQKFSELFSIGIGANYAISRSDTTADAAANGTSVNTGMSLLMQQNVFQLSLKKYQECSIIKVQPRQYLKKGLFEAVLPRNLSAGEQADLADRGLMVCTGTENSTPLVKTENYYLLNQETSNTQIQDSGDARNRNFFMALRGEKDLQRLMYFMKGKLQLPQTADRETDPQKEQMESMEMLFHTGHTNSPGSYRDNL